LEPEAGNPRAGVRDETGPQQVLNVLGAESPSREAGDRGAGPDRREGKDGIPAGWGSQREGRRRRSVENHVGAGAGPGVQAGLHAVRRPEVRNVDAEREPVGEAVLSAEILDVVEVRVLDVAVADARDAARYEPVQRREQREDRAVEMPVVEVGGDILGAAGRVVSLLDGEVEEAVQRDPPDALRKHRRILSPGLAR